MNKNILFAVTWIQHKVMTPTQSQTPLAGTMSCSTHLWVQFNAFNVFFSVFKVFLILIFIFYFFLILIFLNNIPFPINEQVSYLVTSICFCLETHICEFSKIF